MAAAKIIIYTDGACSNNQSSENAGGWGAILTAGAHPPRELYGSELDTTNNRMELTACIRALEAVKNPALPVIIYSDSAYIVNCFKQRWYENWRRNGWKNARKKPVENQDLWEQLLALTERMHVRFLKVKGHAGVDMNERADELARRGAEEAAAGRIKRNA